MAVISNATTTTSLTEVVKSEEISTIVLEANRSAPIANAISWYRDASDIRSLTFTQTIWERALVPTSEASGKAESDEFAVTEQTMAQVQVSHADVGIYKWLSDQARRRTVLSDVVAELVRQSIIEMFDQWNEDLLANITSATNASSFAAAPLTLANWGTARAAFLAQNPNGERFAFAGHNDQFRDLTADLRATGGSIWAGSHGDQASGIMSNVQGGFRGFFEGFELYESGLIPAFDGSNWSGAMCSAGNLGALMFVGWTKIMTESRRVPTRKGDELVTSMEYGTGISNQSNLREVVSQT